MTLTGPDAARTGRGRGLLHEELTKSIIGAFFAAYDTLGFGFSERVCAGGLCIELQKRGHRVAREVSVPVFYDGIQIARYSIDFVVDELVVLEIKASRAITEADHAQLRNYVRCTPLEVGLLMHFGPKPKFYRCIASREFKRPQSGSVRAPSGSVRDPPLRFYRYASRKGAPASDAHQ